MAVCLSVSHLACLRLLYRNINQGLFFQQSDHLRPTGDGVSLSTNSKLENENESNLTRSIPRTVSITLHSCHSIIT